ncbi:MAG: pentapeptide repeat-containing protein [Chroococcales cyanobacterium]
MKKLLKLAVLGIAIAFLLFPFPAFAQATKYYAPPLSYSNAELSGKDFSGEILQGAEFSNANLELTDFSYADLRGAVMSTSVMTKANLHGANLTYGMADQVNFTDADLSDAILEDTILLRSTFEGTNITGADFTNAILDGAQVEELCAKASGVNSTTGVSTRNSLGCQ